jgi:hypothetical protein
VHKLCIATGDKNVSRFLVSFQMKLNAMHRLRHLTDGTLGFMQRNDTALNKLKEKIETKANAQ